MADSPPKSRFAFLNERIGLGILSRFFQGQLRKRLPPHTGWLHVLGSVALLTFLSQIVTGILLLLYYRPTVKEAHESIQYITGEVPFGWLFRQLHAWGATLMMAAVILHMTRTYFMGSFKRPREFTWIIGVALLILTMGFGFTGYLLPWNQLSYWATTVGTEVVGAIPWIGEDLKSVLLGGPAVGQESLSRFFVMHVAVLPWAVFSLVVMHLALMRYHNLATLEDVGAEKPYAPETGVPFWPVHMAKEACVAALLFGTLLTLSVHYPWEIGEPANPLETPRGIKPEWYFLPTYQLLKYFSGPVGKVLGIGISAVPFVLLFIWPFLERGTARRPGRRKFATRLGIIAIVLVVFFGVLGHYSERTIHAFGDVFQIDTYGVPRIVRQPKAAGEGTRENRQHAGPTNTSATRPASGPR